MDGIIALKKQKQYVEESLTGAGALKGLKGDKGDQGLQGKPGKNGISPVITTDDIIDGGHKVTITDATGDHEFNVMDGKDGVPYLVFNATFDDAPQVNMAYAMQGEWFNRIPINNEECSGMITVENITYYATGYINIDDTTYVLVTRKVTKITGEDIENNVIDRCIWVMSAGADLSIFAKDSINVAGMNEFVGAKPKVSSEFDYETGLILVDHKLYWTEFKITEVVDNISVTQQFLIDPILIGSTESGSENSNLADGSIGVIFHDKAPVKDEYFNVAIDDVCGAIPSKGDSFNLIVFVEHVGAYKCDCLVTDYVPGKLCVKVQVAVPPIGITLPDTYTKQEIDEKIADYLFCYSAYPPTVEIAGGETKSILTEYFIGATPTADSYGMMIYSQGDNHYLIRFKVLFADAEIVDVQFVSDPIQINTPDMSQYYNKSEIDAKFAAAVSSGNIKYITGNSKENPFTWNDNEIGIYIFDTYDVWARATSEDTNTHGAQINTYNGALIVLAHITEDTEVDTPIGYYVNNRYLPRIVVYSGQNKTGRIFDIAFPDSSLDSYPLIVNPNGVSGSSDIKFSSPKSNATAGWYESREDNGQYLATIDWVKEYGRNNDFINLVDFANTYQEKFGAPMYDHDFKQIVHNLMYDNRIKAGTYITGNIYTKDTTVPSQYMDCTFYVIVKNENYQQVFIDGYIPDDPTSQRYYTIMTRPAPFSVTDWQPYKWKAYATTEYIDDNIETINNKIGDITQLNTTAKTDLVKAINEVRIAISAGGETGALSIDTETTTDGMLKSYTIKQGGVAVGTIDIPKDLVVTEGSVVTNPEGEEPGTYIKLVIANQEEPLLINVGKLVDIYIAKKEATQIQISIDSDTREISATIVSGSVGTIELADNAVTTVKIADANITLAKLAVDVMNAFDSAGAATVAETNAKNYANSLDSAMDTRVKAVEEKVYEGFETITAEEINSLFTVTE